ncbi:hypothetical protein [Cryobacterium sp. HLT2-28]|uniref:hypothetical protein n=1 Tax=Cryobacterium sp. HLT2-28 TaxID=1259146 RepID=UPI00141BE931|nr:hypothetical protein [Cryobacterium sp. HLT2-28]
MIDKSNLDSLFGATVTDADGDKIGTGADSAGVGVSADTDGRAPREPRAAE